MYGGRKEIHRYVRSGEYMNVPGPKVHYYIDSYGRMWTHDPDYCMGCVFGTFFNW